MCSIGIQQGSCANRRVVISVRQRSFCSLQIFRVHLIWWIGRCMFYAEKGATRSWDARIARPNKPTWSHPIHTNRLYFLKYLELICMAVTMVNVTRSSSSTTHHPGRAKKDSCRTQLVPKPVRAAKSISKLDRFRDMESNRVQQLPRMHDAPCTGESTIIRRWFSKSGKLLDKQRYFISCLRFSS